MELSALFARAESYGTGLGHRLFEAVIGASAAYLWVLDGNQRATAFYERQGFRFDGMTTTEPVGVERRMVRT
ncbi:GNAT family N-acetyltransferase [Nocardioides sp. CCNWLW239]|uniref:GNAT family N-acetyltransferase n=1 Tax=Nocardioides sp. CCNWLW239 TaxID=3128902 RepID=UPI003019157D